MTSGVDAPVVIVGCGSAKQATRTAAGDMYLGGYHRACRRAAATHTSRDRIFILSALHGLLSLDDPIDPYDLRMGQPGSVTVDQVASQARQRGLGDAAEVWVYAGAAYTQVVQSVWPHARAPLAGVGGLGKQLAALAKITSRRAYTPPQPGPGMVQPGLRVEAIAAVRPKTGGRYGGFLRSVGPTTATVDCYDGIRRRFPHQHLLVDASAMLVEAWRNLGYIDAATRRPTTDTWEWVAWTLDQHLAYTPTSGGVGGGDYSSAVSEQTDSVSPTGLGGSMR